MAADGGAVGKQLIECADISQSDQGIAVELAVVDTEIAHAGIVHHRLHDADFLVIVIQKRAVVFYAVGTHDGIVDFELIDEIDSRHARNAAVQGADHAGSDDDRVVGTRRSDGGSVDVVGDNPQVFTLSDQLGGDGFHGCADADKQRGIIGNGGSNQTGNGVFFPAADGCAAPALPLRLKRLPKMRRRDSV